MQRELEQRLQPVGRSSTLLLGLLAAASLGCGPPPSGANDAGAGDAATPSGEPFMWGTEGEVYVLPDGGIEPGAAAAIKVIKGTLGVRYVKIRLSASAPGAGTNFSNEQCLEYRIKGEPQPVCIAYADLAKTAAEIGRNGWSMVPMITPEPRGFDPTRADHRDHYAQYVAWFVSTFKSAANIEYVELLNAPASKFLGFGGDSTMLIDLQNRTFEKVRAVAPEVKVGTAGNEYISDSSSDQGYLLAKEFLSSATTGTPAQFDFWAFHGYSTATCIGCGDPSRYPPTKTATSQNVYSVPAGSRDLRAALDASGWGGRTIVDTEHVPPYEAAGENPHDDFDSAFLVQELVVKRSLKQAGNLVFAGLFPLKIRVRGNGTEDVWGALQADGTPYQPVVAYGLLARKLKDCVHQAHLSGAFDNESEAWVEEFSCPGKTTYVLFKPLTYTAGVAPTLDGQQISYTLNLGVTPKKLTKIAAKDGSSETLLSAATLELSLTNEPIYVDAEP